MSTKETEMVSTKEDLGNFKISLDDLKEIVNMDNRYISKELGGDIKISSNLIVNKHKGIKAICDALQTDPKTGIKSKTDADIAERHRLYGMNSFPPPKIKTIWELIMENFDDRINQILCVAAIVSIIIGLVQHGFPAGLIEGVSILIALNIIISVNSVNNYFSEKRLADLVKLSDEMMVTVYRNSSETITIDSEQLVVGDLVYIESGMKVPADMLMISGQDLSCVEADLTGEPDEQIKHEITSDNMQDIGTLLAKSLVVSGTGTAIVITVGPNTASGKITEQTQKENEPTPLQKKLEVIADKIGNLGIACAVLTFFSMIVRTILEMVNVIPCGCLNIFTCQEPLPGSCIKPNFEFDFDKNPLWNELLNTFIIAVTVIVVAIPEGLPLAVTISLSFASKKMQLESNLVRTLSSAETMGGATHICSDKTGTLTENKMTVMALMAENTVNYNTDSQSDILAKKTKEGMSSSTWQMLIEGLFWNSSARIEKKTDADIKEEKETKDKLKAGDANADKKDAKADAPFDPYKLVGNVTEQGIFKFFLKVMKHEECLTERNKLTEENTCALISFSSKRKRASIVVRNPSKQGQADEVRIYCKGGPDMLFPLCTNVMTASGQTFGFDDQTDMPSELLNAGESSAVGTQRELYERAVKKFATKAYRTILMCYKDLSMAEFEQIKADNNNFESEADREVLETNLTAYGIFALQDPLRKEIVASVKQVKAAGIQTIMCTGDNIDTAIAISIDAGIVTQEEIDRNEESKMYCCMTGKDFRTAVGGLVFVQDPEKDVIKVDPKDPEAHKKNFTDKVADMEKFKQIKKYLKVLARSSPDDKRILVIGVQDSDGVVAVTGDGTNDAPALTKADVGFAMGITGTDVAKGACDIVLLDDNFASIITALRHGRNVFDNVRKFLQFQLTINFAAMFIVFFGSVIIKDSPLNAVQMLWVNLIMDTFAALALATEPPGADILERQPYPKEAPIMSEVMWRNVFGHSLYQIIILIIFIFVGQGSLTPSYTYECYDYNKALATPPVYEYAPCNLAQSTGTKTSIYNPFYTKTLYMDEKVIAYWTKKTTVKGQIVPLKKTDFDQNLLNDFSCFVYLQSNSGNCDELKKSVDWVKNVKLPSEAPKNTGTAKLLHFTLVFQVFVFMQLFNQFNARLLESGQFNIFDGVTKNPTFLFIVVLTFVVQIIMVEVGGQITKCMPLTFVDNVICLAIGSVEFLWGVLIKFTPLKMWQFYSLDPKVGDEQEADGAKAEQMEIGINEDGVKQAKYKVENAEQYIAQRQQDTDNSHAINN